VFFELLLSQKQTKYHRWLIDIGGDVQNCINL